MGQVIDPRVLEGGARGRARANAVRAAERAAGLEYARAWRRRMQAQFDALFGAVPRCGQCGGLIDER